MSFRRVCVRFRRVIDAGVRIRGRLQGERFAEMHDAMAALQGAAAAAGRSAVGLRGAAGKTDPPGSDADDPASSDAE